MPFNKMTDHEAVEHTSIAEAAEDLLDERNGSRRAGGAVATVSILDCQLLKRQSPARASMRIPQPAPQLCTGSTTGFESHMPHMLLQMRPADSTRQHLGGLTKHDAPRRPAVAAVTDFGQRV